MRWHEVLLTALIAIVSVVLFVYLFADYLPNVPVVSAAAHKLGGGAAA